MILVKEWILPVETVSEANVREHWTKKNRRRKKQCYMLQLAWVTDRPIIELPCIVRMTRISTRKMDSDNLQMSMKGIRDYISFLLTGKDKGKGDSDDRIEWQYDQLKGKIKGFGKGLKVEFISTNLIPESTELVVNQGNL